MSYIPVTIDFDDIVRKLAVDLDLDRYTVGYVIKRLRNEGHAFLTVQLPKISKQVLAGLENGFFDRTSLTGFSWKFSSLHIFRSLLSRIFDEKSGVLLAHPCAVSVWTIRQFCDYLYKLAIPFTEKQLEDAHDKFEQIEETLATDCDTEWAEELRKRFCTYYRNISDKLLSGVFAVHRPRFGPGSYSGSGTRLGEDPRPHVHWAAYRGRPSEEIGSHPSSCRAIRGYFKSYPGSPETLKEVSAPWYSEVLFVPKDSRGPRIISKEPLVLLKGQLAFFDWLTASLEAVTKGSVQFTSQDKFRDLAREASIKRSYATLDLQDASDRVRFDLVKYVTRNSPAVRWFLANMRSPVAKTKRGSITLRKVAGMGSGLTFPLMALLIHLSICTSVQKHTGLPYKTIMRSVYVYGDDVIVPNEWFRYAVIGLGRSDLIVNVNKSFTKGYFRESCGGDYLNGNDIGIVRLKLSNSGLALYSKGESFRFSEPNGFLQLERHCRELVKSGLYALSEFYYKKLERTLGKLPDVGGRSPVLGRYTVKREVIREIPDTSSRSLVPTPVVLLDGQQCPYKYLGSFLSYSGDVRENVGQTYGEVALPRKVLLRRRLVYGVNKRS